MTKRYYNIYLMALTLIVFSACSESDTSDDDSEGASSLQNSVLDMKTDKVDIKPKSDSALVLWDSLISPIQNQVHSEVQVWSCDSNEAPIAKLEDIYLNIKNDTLAHRELDGYGEIQSFRVVGTSGREYLWGEGVDSIHWVSPELGKAYQANQKLWHEERRFDPKTFKLSEVKRFSSPEKILLWEKYKYNSSAQITLSRDMVTQESRHYEYSDGLLIKEWSSLKGEFIDDTIDYEYYEEDHLKRGLNSRGKVIIEESLDDFGRVISLEEWDARGKLHCRLFKYSIESPTGD